MNVIHRWRDRDVKRLLKVMREAGLVAEAVEIDTQAGIVRVITAHNHTQQQESPKPTPTRRHTEM